MRTDSEKKQIDQQQFHAFQNCPCVSVSLSSKKCVCVLYSGIGQKEQSIISGRCNLALLYILIEALRMPAPFKQISDSYDHTPP